MTASANRSDSGIDRRTVLLGTGAVGAAGILAACGSSDTTDSTGGEAPDTTASTDVPSSPTKIVSTADVPVGAGIVVEEKMVVVTQPTEGEFKAFTSTCPHQGCTVGEVTSEEIICPCHGSAFSTTTGEVLRGPATVGLAQVAVDIEGDEVVSKA